MNEDLEGTYVAGSWLSWDDYLAELSPTIPEPPEIRIEP
jgi:hypothetical protein